MREVLVDTGEHSLYIARATALNKTLLLSDNRNRTVAYSLESGQTLGRQFGQLRAVDATLGRLCLENADGDVVVVDSGTMKEIKHLNLPSGVVYAGFDGAGKRMLTVRASQQVYIHDLP
jgi:hypothetical protein